MEKIVIITSKDFDDREFLYPFYRLQEAGYQVDVATATNEIVLGKHGIPAQPTVTLKELAARDFKCVVIPGGWAPDHMRRIPEILTFIKSMNETNKIISSTCHGPWVLISAGILKNRTATCNASCKDDLINAGAHYLDQPVVVDINIVTAQHYKDNPEWMKQTLCALERKKITNPPSQT